MGYRSVEGYVVYEPCGHAEPVRGHPGMEGWLAALREAVRA